MKIIFCFLLLGSYSLFGQNSLFSTDFNTGIPSNMTVLNIDQNIPFSSLTEFLNNDAWISISDPDSSSNNVAASTSYYEIADTANRWLITPQITTGSFGNYLSWKSKSHDPSFPDDYLVLLSSTGNNPSDFIDTIGNVQEENFEWTERIIDLSSFGYNDSTIYIAFVLRTFDGFKLYLDDILLESENILNIHSIQENSINIYPNPFSDKINIECDTKIDRVILYNLVGEIVLMSNQELLHLNNIVPGQYVLSILTNNQIINRHIIKY